VKHFCIGWDVRILHEWWRVNGQGMRAMLGAADAGPAPARQTVSTY
jgi:4-hydroxy-2-oxoheptanedioate aldolase